MSENPGVYIAMKSIGPPPSQFQAYLLMQLTPMENEEKNSGLGELRFRCAYVTSKTLTFSYSSFLVLTQFT